MDNPKKSIDQLADQTVKADEIKGGGDITIVNAASMPGMDTGMQQTLGVDPVIGAETTMNFGGNPMGALPTTPGGTVAVDYIPQPGDISFTHNPHIPGDA